MDNERSWSHFPNKKMRLKRTRAYKKRIVPYVKDFQATLKENPNIKPYIQDYLEVSEVGKGFLDSFRRLKNNEEDWFSTLPSVNAVANTFNRLEAFTHRAANDYNRLKELWQDFTTEDAVYG